MDKHEREKIFCSRPDYAEHNSAHRRDDDRVGNGVDCTRMRAESFQFASMAKIKPGACAKPKMRDMSTMPLTSDLKAAASCD